MLPLQTAWVGHLAKELRSHMPHSMAKKIKSKHSKGMQKILPTQCCPLPGQRGAANQCAIDSPPCFSIFLLSSENPSVTVTSDAPKADGSKYRTDKGTPLYQLATAAMTKYQSLGVLDNRESCSHCSGGLWLKVKVSAGFVAGRRLPSLCVRVVVPPFSWCLYPPFLPVTPVRLD